MFNVDSFGNVYFTAGVSVGNYPTITTTPTHVLVSGPGGRISRLAISQLTSSSSPVTSVFGRTGAVIASPGDYDTDDIKENSKLYFTVNRARASISLTALGTTGPATYNPDTGVINVPQYQNEFSGVNSFNTRVGDVVLTALDVTTALTYTPLGVETDPVWEAQKVLYYTKVESDALFALVGHTHTTTEIAEGTNLYFTTARARAALSAGTGISYNAVSGVITNTITQYTDALARLSISLTTNGTTGPSTYNNLTGVFNIPNYTTDLTGYATETYVNTQISGLVDSAPATLDTLNELAAALGDDANFSTTITTLIGAKEPAIAPGTTAQYWRGDKTWQTLPIYSLPIASSTVLGGIKVGSNLSINATTGVLDATFTYTLPTASATVLGGIKVGANLSIDSNGVLSSTDTNTTYTLEGLGGLALSGGIMTGAIILKEGAANGLKFPNDVFGGSGDTAGMRLISRGGEAMSLEVYLTNDADDWFNISVPNANGAKVNGETIWHAGNLTNLNQLTNGPGYITSFTDTNTTYSLTIPASTTKIRLTGSDASTSDITFTGSGATTVTRTSATEFTISSTDTDTNTTYSNFTRTVAGLVPNPGGSTANRYLREDGTWVVPPDNDTTYTLAGLGGVSGTGANGSIALFTGTSSIGSSVITQSGSNILIGAPPTDNGDRLQVNGRSFFYENLYTGDNRGIFFSGFNSTQIGIFKNANGLVLQTGGNIRLTITHLGGALFTQTVTAFSFFESSDATLKTLVQDNYQAKGIDSVVAKLYTKNGKQELGYYAQDLQNVLPSAVSKGSDGLLNLSYREVHTAKIAYLEEKIKQLEKLLSNGLE